MYSSGIDGSAVESTFLVFFELCFILSIESCLLTHLDNALNDELSFSPCVQIGSSYTFCGLHAFSLYPRTIFAFIFLFLDFSESFAI